VPDGRPSRLVVRALDHPFIIGLTREPAIRPLDAARLASTPSRRTGEGLGSGSPSVARMTREPDDFPEFERL
jgi:hypothetical protein